jgi:DNA-binding MarR family transcriptional regulator
MTVRLGPKCRGVLQQGTETVQYYLECVSNIERLHRLFLEVLKTELEAMRVRDISNVQCLILYSIAGDEVSVGELTERSYLLGSNVSYNLKKMVEAGYMTQRRADHDRRSIHVRLTEKGEAFWHVLEAMFARQAGQLGEAALEEATLAALSGHLQTMERFWNLVRARVPRAPEPLVGRPVSPEEAASYFHSPRRTAVAY